MNEYEILSKLLFDKYGKVALTENETSFVVGCSNKILQKDRAEARCLSARRNPPCS